jgi:hypothetical protein
MRGSCIIVPLPLQKRKGSFQDLSEETDALYASGVSTNNEQYSLADTDLSFLMHAAI